MDVSFIYFFLFITTTSIFIIIFYQLIFIFLYHNNLFLFLLRVLLLPSNFYLLFSNFVLFLNSSLSTFSSTIYIYSSISIPYFVLSLRLGSFFFLFRTFSFTKMASLKFSYVFSYRKQTLSNLSILILFFVSIVSVSNVFLFMFFIYFLSHSSFYVFFCQQHFLRFSGVFYGLHIDISSECITRVYSSECIERQ